MCALYVVPNILNPQIGGKVYPPFASSYDLAKEIFKVLFQNGFKQVQIKNYGIAGCSTLEGPYLAHTIYSLGYNGSICVENEPKKFTFFY